MRVSIRSGNGGTIRLADFIQTSQEPILSEWESFARSLTGSAGMAPPALRDHCAEILRATEREMRSEEQSAEPSTAAGADRGGAGAAMDKASDQHAIERLVSGFGLNEVVAEYGALRASVLRLWRDSHPRAHPTDIDDMTRFNQAIDQSLARAVRSYTARVDQARDLFLAILGHDLRNPLNAISMTAQALPGADDAETSQQADRITAGVSTMARMIGDLLDYTRTRLGAGMPVSLAPMDLVDLGRELYEEFAANPGSDIRFRAEDTVTGEWDADRLRQAISNLLGNAIQHGDPALPVILAIEAEGDDVVIRVCNGGPPIAAENLPGIFDPLVRGSGPQRGRKRAGSIGLGLYIAREVALSHGGQIGVTSSLEDGTVFWIRLPRSVPAPVGKAMLPAHEGRQLQAAYSA